MKKYLSTFEYLTEKCLILGHLVEWRGERTEERRDLQSAILLF